jgi:RNA polymerase sigma factor (sigma-70 family)
MLPKEVMIQYRDMQEELRKLREDIQKTESDIEKLIEEGTVCDKVKGGLGGIQGFKIEGFPVAEYERRRNLLRARKNRLIEKENKLLELTETIEGYIDRIPASRDRRIFQAIFLENKTQQQIADEIHVDRSLISKIIGKYI